jgi:hypothetical protein
MRVRALDENGDWTFGKGKNSYLVDKQALGQNITTRLKSFLGDCFFDLRAGIDWFTLMGGKDQLSIELNVATTILNTPDVTGLETLDTIIDARTRNITISYAVASVYGLVSDEFSLDQNPIG